LEGCNGMINDFSLLHKFSFDDTYIVLDVNSGIVHSLSREAWDYLNAWEETGDAQKAIALLETTHDRRDLEQIRGQIEELQAGGLLFSRDETLESYEARGSSVVKALCLHVAHDCNLHCRYCFAGTGNFGGDRSLMDLETGKRALDFLFEISGQRKHVEIDYFGGEPLLNFTVVKDLIRYGKAKAHAFGKILKQTLTTNAVLLNEEKSAFLDAENVHLILSIDGRPEVHDRMRPFAGCQGSYAAVCKSIRTYLDSQKLDTYYVRGTYTHYNLDFCEDVLHLVEQGFTRVSLEPVVASPEEEYALKEEDLPVLGEQYEKLARAWLEYYRQGKPFEFFHFNVSLDKGPCLIKRLSGCGAGHEYLAVSPGGDLYPCHQFMGQKEFLMGNVHTGIFNHQLGEQFKSAHALNKQPCRQCWARFYCSGGCHANAYNFNGDIYKPYLPGCALQKKRLECAIYLQVKRWESRTYDKED